MKTNNPYSPPASEKGAKSSLFLVHSGAAYLKFFVINVLLIASYQWFFLARDGQVDIPFFVSMLLPAIAVILLQYPIINAAKSRILKLFLFYLSMVLFLFVFGLILSWNISVGSNPAGSLSTRLDGSIRIVLFGHLFGLPYFPVVVLCNFLFRKQFFYQHNFQTSNNG